MRNQSSLFGRERELTQLREALHQVAAGQPRCVLLLGDAGIGKTRLADAAAREARARGFEVVWGSCWESAGAPALWPWRRALAGLVDGLDSEQWRACIGGDAPALAAAFPEIAARLGDGTTPHLALTPEARFSLFESVSSFLTRAAARRPLAILLDDIHWADTDSLLLLHFLARDAAATRLLVVATLRDVDAERRPEEFRILTTLGRERAVERLHLEGLTRDAVAGLLDAELGHATPDSTVDRILTASGGNPFFVRELARLCTAEGAILPSKRLPASVRDVVEQRLAPLPAATREILRLGAIVGRDFDLALLELVEPGIRERFRDDLQPAIDARLIVEKPAAAFGFVHALVGEVLRQEIPAARRAAWHGLIGRALQTNYGDDESQLAALAHHFLMASDGDASYTAQAIDCSLRAAQRASAAAAYGESVALLERALPALERTTATGLGDSPMHCSLLVALGDAQRLAGHSGAAATMRAAAAMARRIDAPTLFAQAALGHADAVGLPPGDPDPDVLALLEEASTRLQTEAETENAGRLLRGRVLGRIAIELFWSTDLERRCGLSRTGVALVRPFRNPAELGRTLFDHHWAILGADTLAERCGVAEEILALPIASPLVDTRLLGHGCRIQDRLELGDIDGVDADIAAFTHEVSILRQNRLRWWLPLYRGLRLMIDGRLAQAEESLTSAMAEAERLASREAPMHGGAQLIVLRDFQGRLAEMEPWAAELARQHPAQPVWLALLSVIHATAGRDAEARAEVEAILARDLVGAPRDASWLLALALVTRTLGALEWAAPASDLYAALLPYAERNIVVGTPSGCLGSASRFLGTLASLDGRRDLAVRHFEDAWGANTRLRAWPLVALTEADYAAALRRGGRPEDQERVGALVASAHAAAQRIGMRRLVADCDALRACQPVETTPTAAATSDTNVFRRDGDYWTLQFRGQLARLRTARGLEHLAVLLARPGTPVHVLELAGSVGDTGDAGVVLDRRAVGEYRDRLAELRRERDEAERFADLGRRERLDAEIAQITAQLSAGLGLGGRERRALAASERARLSVTKAIRASLERVETAQPRLAAHLRATVRTGTMCVYAPDPNQPIRWQTH